MRIPNHLQASRNPAHNLGVACIVGVGLLAAIFVTPALWAQQWNQLADFNGPNGNNPGGKLAMDAAGNIYGTTYYGGSNYCSYGCGTVYKLSKHGSQWMLSTLYDFKGNQDGAHPWGGITLGPDGALYGTTYEGGLYGEGAAFKLQPQPTRCTTALCYWTKTVIYNFTGGSDGGAPQGAVIFDSASNLYGTTLGGGSGHGVVYELSPAQGSWNINVLYAFQGGSDGNSPEDGVVMDQSGNLYGTTFLGGADSVGTVYELTKGASGWTETVLHSFTGGDDGIYPTVPVLDPSGNVFGATTEEGANRDGTVFELQPTGSGGFNYSIIYQFNSRAGPPCDAECGFITDSAGNLYASGYGGMNGGGTIFKLSPSNGSWNLTVLWDLTQEESDEPSSRLIFDAQGNLYGTTEYGGIDFDGNVWQLTP